MIGRHQLPAPPERCASCDAAGLPGIVYSYDDAGRLHLEPVLLELSAYRLANVPASHPAGEGLRERGLVCGGLDPWTGRQRVVPLWGAINASVLRSPAWRAAGLHLHLLHVCPVVPAAWASTSTPTAAAARATATDRTATPR